jgi:hypothetical protein
MIGPHYIVKSLADMLNATELHRAKFFQLLGVLHERQSHRLHRYRFERLAR